MRDERPGGSWAAHTDVTIRARSKPPAHSRITAETSNPEPEPTFTVQLSDLLAIDAPGRSQRPMGRLVQTLGCCEAKRWVLK